MQLHLSLDPAPAPRRATFSPCRRYRYRLEQGWGSGGRVLFVLLNPSTADELNDDPTVRRCWTFAADWGYGRGEVCNLFAWRDTDPRGMLAAEDPVGPENDFHLLEAADQASLIVCGWGAYGAHRGRAAEVTALLRGAGHTLYALGFTRDGQPRHPLYLRRQAVPTPFGDIPVDLSL